MRHERFHRAQLIATPWKNGGGATREIVRFPVGAALDAIDWRASIAEVATDGPFSVFEGVDRTIVLLDGNGVTLRSSDGRIIHELDTPLAPFAFSGDEPIVAALVNGASSDFNVMVRRATVRGDVRIVRASERLSASDAGVLFVARGSWDVTPFAHDPETSPSDTIETLGTGAGVWWNGDRTAWALRAHDANAALIAVNVGQRPRRG